VGVKTSFSLLWFWPSVLVACGRCSVFLPWHEPAVRRLCVVRVGRSRVFGVGFAVSWFGQVRCVGFGG